VQTSSPDTASSPWSSLVSRRPSVLKVSTVRLNPAPPARSVRFRVTAVRTIQALVVPPPVERVAVGPARQGSCQTADTSGPGAPPANPLNVRCSRTKPCSAAWSSIEPPNESDTHTSRDPDCRWSPSMPRR
jgi:hypothetical protein